MVLALSASVYLGAQNRKRPSESPSYQLVLIAPGLNERKGFIIRRRAIIQVRYSHHFCQLFYQYGVKKNKIKKKASPDSFNDNRSIRRVF
jgi:hypothetical protein